MKMKDIPVGHLAYSDALPKHIIYRGLTHATYIKDPQPKHVGESYEIKEENFDFDYEDLGELVISVEKICIPTFNVTVNIVKQ